ncbi:MAG: nucleoside triphosphate pyrophosphohydrolase [Armatimonadota bacterium]
MNPLLVVGLGPGARERLPNRNLAALKAARAVLLRTQHHPSTKILIEEGIAFETCDDIYDKADTFEELYEGISERAAALPEGAAFAVPGHPLVGEESVRRLTRKRECTMLPAPSFIEVALEACGEPFSNSLQTWNAHDPEGHFPDPRSAQLVYQVDSKEAASNAKLRLMRFFEAEHPVVVVHAAGTDEQSVTRVPLHELDHLQFTPLTTVFVPPAVRERAHGFYGLVEIVDRLLGPGGCPWDRAQTHETLKKHLLEETYETLAAIDSGDSDKLCEELGDLLLQPLMHAQMDAIEGMYDIDDVIAGISEKLVRRHPHVFGDAGADTADEVLANWDAIKQQERGEEQASILEGVPDAMPSLLRAFEVSKRAARVGFEWPSVQEVWKKVDEERDEFLRATRSGDEARAQEEFGDLLFSLVNIARWHGIEPEDALRRMVNRFCTRFQEMEATAGKPLRELSAEEWDELWLRAKSAEAGGPAE